MDHKEHKDTYGQWAWREQSVDPVKDHLDLRYGSVNDANWDAWVLVARVSRPIKKVFGVEFFIDAANSTSASMIAAVVRELDFYLLTRPDPWDYAQYHCGTGANLYSSVHWSFHRGKGKQCSATKKETKRGSLDE
jgi:hypothetical protein